MVHQLAFYEIGKKFSTTLEKYGSNSKFLASEACGAEKRAPNLWHDTSSQ